jgi:Contractile injection system tube protein/LysM domain
MPDVPNLAKAELRQLDANFANEINQSNWTKVQFNPDSLKVTFANQVATPSGSGDQSGPQARQFVGAGTTKLAVALSFDVTSEIPQELPQVDDVRQLTQRVAYFITPAADPPTSPKNYIPPATRFAWGSFQFDGIMESMEETLELFSFEGRPLRATVSIVLSQQKITAFTINSANAPPPATRQGGSAPGTSPLTEAPAGASLQSLAANQPGLGVGADWQSIASANGIENPRLLQPGQLVDLNPPSVTVQLG